MVLADLGVDAASALARELGGDRAPALTVDVTDTAALADAVDRTVEGILREGSTCKRCRPHQGRGSVCGM